MVTNEFNILIWAFYIHNSRFHSSHIRIWQRKELREWEKKKY